MYPKLHHTVKSCISKLENRMYMQACMYIYMYACMHNYMLVYMYVCMYACMHACMHACVYVCLCKYVYRYVCMLGLFRVNKNYWNKLNRLRIPKLMLAGRPVAVISVAPTGKASFVCSFVQTSLMGQYIGKRPFSLVYVLKPLIIPIRAIGYVQT